VWQSEWLPGLVLGPVFSVSKTTNRSIREDTVVFASFFFQERALQGHLDLGHRFGGDGGSREAVMKYSKKVDKADRHHGAVTKKRKTKKPDREPLTALPSRLIKKGRGHQKY
jgi:hypothetical protein